MPHRYWRVLVTSLQDTGGWGLAELDMWEGQFGPSAFARAGWTLDSSGTANGDVANVADGSVLTDNSWISTVVAEPWISVDFGIGVEVDIYRVNLWKLDAGNNNALEGDVQYSDNGVDWSTAWSFVFVSGDYDDTGGRLPAVTIDPAAPDNPADTPLLMRFGEAEYWLDPAGDVYSDDGVTPIADGQGVYLAENAASYTGADDFVQPSAGLRPTWRESGDLGFPYLDCDGTMRFENVAWAQPSGVTTVRPWQGWAVVGDPARSGFPAFWGSADSASGGKAQFYLRPGNADEEVRFLKPQFQFNNYTSDSRLIGGRASNYNSGTVWVDNTASHSNGTNIVDGSAITEANVLWNDGLGSDDHYSGELYALLITDGASFVDSVIIQQWLWGKYVVGFAGGGGEIINPSAGALQITGSAPGVVIDEIVAPGAGALQIAGTIPNVVTDEDIEPPAGVLEITGIAPLVLSGVTISTAPGDVVIDGTRPIVSTFAFMGASQQAVIVLAEPENEARISQQAAIALAEIVPDARISQQAAITLATVIPPVRVSQEAVIVLADGDPCITRRAQCWRIERRDGEVFTFTSHDRPVTFRGEEYSPCNSLTASASEASARVGGVGDMALNGIIDDAGIREEDLFAGLFDDAFVEVWYLNWAGDPDTVRRLAAGWLGAVSYGEKGFDGEVLGPGSRLEQRPLTDTVTPGCRWDFGDTRCAVDIEALALLGTVTAAAVRDQFVANITGVPGSAQYEQGIVRWTSGVNDGYQTEVRSYDAGTGEIVLWIPAPFTPSAGDTFDLLPGCDKLDTTCKDVYSNMGRNGGFPDVPGEDSLTETPKAKY